MRPFLEIRPARRPFGLRALALLALLIAPPTILAQEGGPIVRGVVRDSAGRPLEGAEVKLYGSPRVQTSTGSDGAFRFTGLRNSRYWLLVRRIGYLPHMESLSLEDDEVRDHPVTLEAAPQSLPEVVVAAEASRYERRMRDFMWRSRASFGGRFLTRDDIADARPVRLGDLVVRYLPFKRSWVMDQPGGWGPAFPTTTFDAARLSRLRHYRPDCPPAVALNGGPVSLGLAVNDFAPDDIEALEVYREGSDLPIEYSFAGQTQCGLVVVWLRSYAQLGAER